jgi:ADP-ribose pyrophosphatase YjhB (NUDIX family)
MFGVYSEPERDPRGHVISVVYILKSDGVPVAKDDDECTLLPIQFYLSQKYQ